MGIIGNILLGVFIVVVVIFAIVFNWWELSGITKAHLARGKTWELEGRIENLQTQIDTLTRELEEVKRKLERLAE